MRKWKWEKHHYRYLRLSRMRLRRLRGALRKQLSAMPDPTPRVVPVSVDKELQRATDWYRSLSLQGNGESSAPYYGSADCPYFNERSGIGKKINQERGTRRIQKSWMPVRCMKAGGSKEGRSQRRRWWEEQSEHLHRRANPRLERNEIGRYEEKP